MNAEELYDILKNRVEVLLKPIGGHKIHHLEGNAWEHTLLVISEMGNDPLYKLVGLLHDIGKSQYYEIDEEGWYTYPNHAKGGAEMLKDFIPENYPMYDMIYWVIANHIKIIHLFRDNDFKTEIKKLANTIPSNVNNKEAWLLLLTLGIADLKGSVCVDEKRRGKEEVLRKMKLARGIFEDLVE